MLGLVFGLVFFALLYVNLLIVRWLTPTTRILTPEQEAVDRVRQSLEPYLRWLIPLAAAALALIVGIGVSRQWQVFLLWRNGSGLSFGSTEPHLRSRPRVLRVLAAVAAVPPGLAVLVARRRDPDRRDRALRVGRHPAAGAGVRRQGGAGRARAPVRAARPDLPREGVGVLPRPVRPADVAARRRGGRVVHRREGAAARAELPGDRRGDLRRAVPREHPRAAVEPAGDRGRRPRRWCRSCSGRPIRRSCSSSASSRRSSSASRPYIEYNIEGTRRAFGLDAIERVRTSRRPDGARRTRCKRTTPPCPTSGCGVRRC